MTVGSPDCEFAVTAVLCTMKLGVGGSVFNISLFYFFTLNDCDRLASHSQRHGYDLNWQSGGHA
jgi:hypothetical protein